MEIKKVESVVMTGTELHKIISDYVRDHYNEVIAFNFIDVCGETYYLDITCEIIFRTE